MQVQGITHTHQLNWQFDTHSFGACAKAATDITAGQTVKFDVFTRSKDDSTKLHYVNSFYFGLMDIDGTPALRVSHCTNLDAHETHSLIASWNTEANNPVYISARLTMFLMREGTDWFINPQFR